MTEEKMKELLKNNLNKNYISKFFEYENLEEEFIERYIGYFDEFYQFEKIVSNEVPENWWIEFIENEFGIEELWSLISVYQKLSEGFIERHSNKVNWYFISSCQKFSEKFIEKHSDKVDWVGISSKQKLSEPFIEKNCDKVDWYFISKHQNLSESFIEKHSDKVDWYMISQRKNISKQFIKKYKKEIENGFFSSF